MNLRNPLKTGLILQGRMAETVLLTYRTPVELVVGLLPDGLEPVRRGPWAFWQVVCRRVEDLRPSGVPAAMGASFNHVAYRLRVQAMTASAQVVTGLYDLHSVIDAPFPKLVDVLGHRLTDTPPTHGCIAIDGGDCGVSVGVAAGDTRNSGQAHALRLDLAHAPAARRPDSCYATLADVREHCAPAGATLSLDAETGVADGRVLRVMRAVTRGRGSGETPLVVREQALGYFDAIGQAERAVLEWAARLRPVETRWEIDAPQSLLGAGAGRHQSTPDTRRAECLATTDA